MEEKIITSVESYLSSIYDYPETFFFRGQSSIGYKLIPSIGRMYKDGEDKLLLQFEKEIFEDFKRKYSMFTDVRPTNDKEFLFLAQHYGLPTRLLDWTYNPLIALYFACCSNPNENGVVYHSYPFSHMIFDEKAHEILNFPQPTILIPNLTDVRYRNQNGLFILYSTPWKEDFTHIMVKYIIPAKCKESMMNKMAKIGITRSFIMPSLDSLCVDIVSIYKVRYAHGLK